MTILLRYPEWGCEHEFSDDWTFGGAVGGDPRADERWMPSTYEYLNRSLHAVYFSSTPLCDHQAIKEERLQVDRRHPNNKVFYIRARRHDGTEDVIYSDIEGALGGSAS